MTCKDCVHYEVCNRVEKQIVFTDSSFEKVINSLIKCCRHSKTKQIFVEVKHGRWERCIDWEYDFCCSECGDLATLGEYNNHDVLTDYCPNCGADMRKEGADNG